MSVTVNGIMFLERNVLGAGSSSVVYQGHFAGREVAIKKLPIEKIKIFQTEIDLLIKSDTHKNIVKYFTTERDSKFNYIALERCHFTMKDYVNRADLKQILPRKQAICQIFEGVEWLHALCIIHRDIKPSNILLLQKSANELEVKISDFGISKLISDTSSEMSIYPEGSLFWSVPEVKQGRYNMASDVYSLGCLTYYIFNDGRIQTNGSLLDINWNNFSDGNTSDGILARYLITVMTRQQPEMRPKLECILTYPFFWDNAKILEFFVAISNRLELRDSAASQANNFFQENADSVTQGNWLNALDEEVRAALPHRNRMNYSGYSIEHLIRALRNKKNHYDDMPMMAKSVLGPLPDGYIHYWTGKFPKLLIYVYTKFFKSGLQRESNFAAFYPKANKCNVPEV